MTRQVHSLLFYVGCALLGLAGVWIVVNPSETTIFSLILGLLTLGFIVRFRKNNHA